MFVWPHAHFGFCFWGAGGFGVTFCLLLGEDSWDCSCYLCRCDVLHCVHLPTHARYGLESPMGRCSFITYLLRASVCLSLLYTWPCHLGGDRFSSRHIHEPNGSIPPLWCWRGGIYPALGLFSPVPAAFATTIPSDGTRLCGCWGVVSNWLLQGNYHSSLYHLYIFFVFHFSIMT